MEAQGKASTPGQWYFSLVYESLRRTLASLARLQPAALIAVGSAHDSSPKCQPQRRALVNSSEMAGSSPTKEQMLREPQNTTLELPEVGTRHSYILAVHWKGSEERGHWPHQ